MKKYHQAWNDALFSKVKKGLLLTLSQQIELVLLLLAASTGRLKAVWEMRRSIKATR